MSWKAEPEMPDTAVLNSTRAKDELVLNSCDNRWQYGNMKECEESRFINEMLPLDDE